MDKCFLLLCLLLLPTSGEALTLQWTYPIRELNTATRFHIYRQENCEGHYTLKGIVFYPADTFKDTSVEKGRTYCYTITTSDGDKESPYGNYIRVKADN